MSRHTAGWPGLYSASKTCLVFCKEDLFTVKYELIVRHAFWLWIMLSMPILKISLKLPNACVSSLAMVLNTLAIDPRRAWKGPWRWCAPIQVPNFATLTPHICLCVQHAVYCQPSVLRSMSPMPASHPWKGGRDIELWPYDAGSMNRCWTAACPFFEWLRRALSSTRYAPSQ
jgi:hypothetical protein